MQSDISRDEYFPKLNNRLLPLKKGAYAKNRKDMFTLLRPNMAVAIANAKRLYNEKEGLTPTEAAPCTKVFELIEMLLPYIKESN